MTDEFKPMTRREFYGFIAQISVAVVFVAGSVCGALLLIYGSVFLLAKAFGVSIGG